MEEECASPASKLGQVQLLPINLTMYKVHFFLQISVWQTLTAVLWHTFKAGLRIFKKTTVHGTIILLSMDLTYMCREKNQGSFILNNWREKRCPQQQDSGHVLKEVKKGAFLIGCFGQHNTSFLCLARKWKLQKDKHKQLHLSFEDGMPL